MVKKLEERDFRFATVGGIHFLAAVFVFAFAICVTLWQLCGGMDRRFAAWIFLPSPAGWKITILPGSVVKGRCGLKRGLL